MDYARIGERPSSYRWGEFACPSGHEVLEFGFDVVAERERELRGAQDGARVTCHRRYRFKGGDDLVARGSGCQGKRHGVLERGRRSVDGDRCSYAHECRGPRIESGGNLRALLAQEQGKECLVVDGEATEML